MINELLTALSQISGALTKDLSIWWLLTPIILIWIMMELYFGEYKKEKLGFSSALANGVSLSWVNISTFRILFLTIPEQFAIKFSVLILLFLYGLFIIFLSFKHIVPEKIIDILAGPKIIYSLSILSVLWGQTGLEVNFWISLVLLCIFLVISLIFLIIKHFLLGLLGEVEAIRRGEEPL